jgi:hypothetical protein
MHWINLAEDRDQWRALVNTVMNVRVPPNVGKFLSNSATGDFSRRAQLHVVISTTCTKLATCAQLGTVITKMAIN